MAITNTMSNEWGLSSSDPVSGSLSMAANTKVFVLLIIGGTTTARTGGSPTYNGVALSQLGTNQSGSAECSVELWKLDNPPIGYLYTLSVPNNGGLSLRMMWAGLGSSINISQFGSAQQTGTSSSVPSLTINNVPAGGACVAVLGHGYKDAPTARSHTTIYENDEGGYSSNGQHGLIASLSNVTMSWTLGGSDDVAMIMAAFYEAGISIDKTETGKLTEDKSVSVASQATLSPSVTQAVALTEARTVAIQEPVVEDLNVTTPVETGLLTEDKTVSVASQPTIQPAAVQSGLLTEDKTVSVVAQATLQPQTTQVGLLTEDKAVAVEPQVALQPQVTQAGLLTEDKSVAVSGQVSLQPQVVQTGTLTEERQVSIAAQPTLQPSVAESVLITEVAAASVAAQASLAPSATQEGRLVEEAQVAVVAQVALTPGVVQTAKLTEEPSVSVSTQATLTPESIDTAALNEDRALVLGEPQVETLQVSNVTEAAALAEASSVAIEAQPTLAPGVVQTALLVELVAVNAPQPALAPEVVEAALLTEVVPAISVSSQPVLEVPGLEQVIFAEYHELAIGAIQPLEVPKTDICQLNEAIAVYLDIQPEMAVMVAELAALSEIANISTGAGGGEFIPIWRRRRVR